MKRIVVLAAVLIAISTVSVNAAATTVPESVYADSIAPYYETAFDAVSTLTLSGKTVKCESKLRGHSDVKSCKVEQTLEKKLGLWIWNSGTALYQAFPAKLPTVYLDYPAAPTV